MYNNFSTLSVNIKQGVAVIVMDNPPVNQLSEHFVAELSAALNGAFEDSEVKAVVLTGTGKNFIAGADLKEIYGCREREPLLAKVESASGFLNRIELGPKPVIAAINGNVLGGGLEIAMACHYRAVSRDAKLGLPEVQLGLIPGAGGTQRLPRLIGLTNALEMIASGAPISSEKALSRRLVDEVVAPDEVLETAVEAAHKFLDGRLPLNIRRTRFKHLRLPSIGELKAVTAEATRKFIRRPEADF
ncbi:MAG: enoyl-CoA hydratase-related protein, partial [Pseudomonadota bacterium]